MQDAFKIASGTLYASRDRFTGIVTSVDRALRDRLGSFDNPDKHFKLESLAVHPDCQRHGVGSALVRSVLANCAHETMPVITRTPASKVAVPMLQKLGFKRAVVAFQVKTNDEFGEDQTNVQVMIKY